MLEAEVLISKFLAVDGFPSGAVAHGEISTLDHEVVDDTMEARSFVAKAFLTSSQSPISCKFYTLITRSTETHRKFSVVYNRY